MSAMPIANTGVEEGRKQPWGLSGASDNSQSTIKRTMRASRHIRFMVRDMAAGMNSTPCADGDKKIIRRQALV